MNLITAPWLPVRSEDGRQVIRPAEIVRPDVLSLDFPRADMNGSILEMLVGLIATACPPASYLARARGLDRRPSIEELDAAFTAVAPAFDIDKFMQWSIVSHSEDVDFDRLFLDNEGDFAVEQFRDLLNRRHRIGAISPAMAAAALYTVQSRANQGGKAGPGPDGKQGVGQSLRGAGPITTLVRAGSDLWGQVWPNVETRDEISDRAIGTPPSDPLSAFPWMAAKSRPITPDGRHPCMVYWATPRAITIVLSNDPGACSLTGEHCERLVTGIRMTGTGGSPYEGWSHPLSPEDLKKHGWQAQQTNTRQIGMREWLAYVRSRETKTARAARCVTSHRLHTPAEDARLVAFGYAAPGNKIRAWQYAEPPLISGRDETETEALDLVAEQLIEATSLADYALWLAVFGVKRVSADVSVDAAAKKVSTRRKAETRPAGVAAAEACRSVWSAMEQTFFDALTHARDALSEDGDDPTREVRAAYYAALRRQCHDEFERACPIDAERIAETVAAQGRLNATLHGQKIYATLGLPQPEKRDAERTAV